MSIAEKLTTIAENEQRVYDKGKSNGASDNLKKVWDEIQNNGSRTNYQYAFNYQRWDEETFRPNYDIKFGADTRNVFTSCKFNGSLKKALDNAGVKLDTSACINLYTAFYSMSYVTELPQIDLRKATGNITNVLHACPKLERIYGGIICSESTNFVSTTFGSSGMGALEDCIFSGVIGKNLNLSNLTGLNKESIMSAINCLKDYSDSGTTYTLTLGTTLQAKLTEEEKAIAQGKGWTVA
jgi:hypothetical protein